MFKLIKYIRPYTLPIIVAIGLLFLQANMDLALPDYMSKIVNTGIQQGGVDTTIPVVIRESKLDTIKTFMDSSTLSLTKKLYVKTADSTLAEKFTNLDKEEVYYLTDKHLIYPEYELSFAKALIADTGMASKLEGMDDNFIIQGAMAMVRTEYEILGADMGVIQSVFILKTGGLMLIMTLVSVICAISVGFIGAKTSAGSARTIRRDLFSKVESFSNAEFDTFSTASLITRSTNDVTQVQNVIFMVIRIVIYAPILGVGGFFRAMSKAPSMGWLIGIAVIVLLGIIGTIISIAMPKFKIVQEFIDRLNLVARENLSGLLVVRAFNRQKFEEKRFDTVNRDLTKTNLFLARTMVVAMPLIMLLMNGLAVVIIWIGSKEVAIGSMQVGDMMAFIQYAMQIVMSFMMLSMVFISVPRATVSANRINEVLQTKPSVLDPINPKVLSNDVKGLIEFKNVNFRYPGGEADALSNISFTARPGTTTAFIGSTGSGKSTIVNLIPRFYDVTGGEITVDGTDIRDISQFDLRNVIGFVPQKNVLFSGTIESNLKYGKTDGTELELETATSIAQATEFISEKDEKYKFAISQDGTNVSGGQRQRLAISRALMKKAPVYIFDDSFSALDFKTDANLRRDLKANTGESTILLVAQRVATIMSAEQIIVLDEGKIVGKGTHEQLLKSCLEYREIAVSQLGLQEEV
ncbi:MAG: ABC transporter ATP-binding protein/permease [Spirochaetaceae bacterium]